MRFEKPLSKKSKRQNIAEDSHAAPKAKGERLRRLRLLANLSREAFCQSSDVNVTTLISWEVGRFGGLSPKGARKVIERVAKEGVFCSIDWLLYEIGAGPEVRVDYKKIHLAAALPNEDSIDENAIIAEELMLFRRLNKNASDFIIEDDGMLPHYQAGDYVAGCKRHGEKIAELVGLDCIVQINDGRLTFRNLQQGPRSHSYHLVCTNLHTKTKESIIYDIELSSAAAVIWHRRKDSLVKK